VQIQCKIRSIFNRAHDLVIWRIIRPLLLSKFRRKRISAMMRVKNEETFLRASVESILPLVDEVVIIDNDSRDGTPAIACELARLHPEKIRLYDYPYAVAKVGSENQSLASRASDRNSPRLLSNYYNWCLSQCRMNYVLKWDGDMVATPPLARHLAYFKNSSYLVMMFFGANLHPDRDHLIGASDTMQQEIQASMAAPMTVENWTSAYSDLEPWLFPRILAKHRTDYWWCEKLHTPWIKESISINECCFLHLKYCKPNPYEHWSNDFADMIKKGVVPGPVVPSELRELVELISTGNST
jgi:Beta-1,4-N-acetylgalactosaminyltransferase (CgtA)